MASVGNLCDSQPHFLKTELDNNSTRIGKDEWNAYFEWYFEAFKCYQASEVACLQNKSFRLNRGYWTFKEKRKWPPCWVAPPPSHLRLRPCSLRLLEPLMLSDLPLPASLPPIPISLSLKLSPLRIPVNLRVHMFPGLKLTYDP